MVKSFEQFLTENYLEDPVDPSVVKDNKTRLKNG